MKVQLCFLILLVALANCHEHPTKEDIQAELNEKTIYYGSTVRIRNQQTRHHIFSMDVSYGSGSRGQVLTAIDSDTEMGSLFIIKSGYNKPIQTFNNIVKCGDTIRLENSNTRKNIYAAGFQSPISNKMEVSCAGNNGENNNGNDNFVIECIGEKAGSDLMGKTEFYLQNAPSGQYMTASRRFFFNQSNCGFNCPIMNHLEVACQRSKDNESKWKITGGIILQKSTWTSEPENDNNECDEEDDEEFRNECLSKANKAADDDGFEEIDFSRREDL